MADSKTHHLVDGTFSTKDARDIICHLFDKKINYHACRILSSYERFGIEDDHSRKRIEELKRAKAEMLEMVKLAGLTGQQLEVQAEVKVCLTSAEATAGRAFEIRNVFA